MISHLLPTRRQKDISVQMVANETLVYDEARHKAFCLNAISSAVWHLADGRNTIAQIADRASGEMQHPVTEEIVRFALSELQRDGLLEGESATVALHAISRRDMVVKIGKGAAILLPLVTGVFTPKKAMACGGGCLLPDTQIMMADGTELARG